jgi:hypothetical protein
MAGSSAPGTEASLSARGVIGRVAGNVVDRRQRGAEPDEAQEIEEECGGNQHAGAEAAPDDGTLFALGPAPAGERDDEDKAAGDSRKEDDTQRRAERP